MACDVSPVAMFYLIATFIDFEYTEWDKRNKYIVVKWQIIQFHGFGLRFMEALNHKLKFALKFVLKIFLGSMKQLSQQYSYTRDNT